MVSIMRGNNSMSTEITVSWGGAGPMKTVADSALRSNEWFTVEVVAVDDRIIVKVNGRTSADEVDAARRFPVGHAWIGATDDAEEGRLRDGPRCQRSGMQFNDVLIR